MPPQAPRPPPVDEELLAHLEAAFAKHAGDDARIDAEELRKALGLRSPYLAGRVLAAFDTNRDGFIDRAEFLAGVRALVFGTDREKLAFAFRIHDHDGDGALGQQDLLRMITMALGESGVVERATQPPEVLTRILFGIADRNRDGRISFEELEAVVRRRPELLRRMTQSEATWILPNEDLLAWVERGGRARRGDRLAALRERGCAPWVFLLAWIGAQAAILVTALLAAPAGPPQEPLVQAGRALGRCIDLDGALILVSMMRRLLTRVRASWLGRLVPVDESIELHKIVGHTMFALALAHTAAFTLAFAVGHAAAPAWGVVLGRRGATGAALLLVFAVMWIFALGFIRRTSRFELFYVSHLLYVAWFVLALVHAPPLLAWAGVPLLGFAIEQLVRLRRRGPASAVLSARPLRSGVVALEVARPPGFAFGAGDYAFLRLPWVAKREWHPFTISSAPERDALTFHVRSLGNWTGTLRAQAERAPDAPGRTAYVDGPYGSPSAAIFRSRHVVLVGAGIGVTPFASVLESLVLRSTGASTSPSALEKVHFFWLNRDQHSFEWFAALIAQLEKRDTGGLVDFHLCMTAGKTGVTTLGLELAREAMRAAGRSDVVTGLRTRTHFGAPDWNGLLGAIARQHAPDPVDVFFCGPPGLAATLRRVCAQLGMPFHEERF